MNATATETTSAAAIVTAEIERINTGGATADGRTGVNLVEPAAFHHHATPIAQTLLDAIRGYGLRLKPETAEQIHAALGLIAVAAVPTREFKEAPLRWWKETYDEDSLLGYLAHRLDRRPDTVMHSAVLQAAFTAAAETLVDEAFEAAPVTVRAEDHKLLLDIGSWTSLVALVEADEHRKRPRGKAEIRSAVERLAEEGVVYCTEYSYRDGELGIVPTPAGEVVLKKLQDERAARIRAREAERDAAIDALLPDFIAAVAAVKDAFADTADAWEHLETCDQADLPAAIEHLDTVHTGARNAAKEWNSVRTRLREHLTGHARSDWPRGGSERVAAVLSEAGINLGGTALDGSAQQLPTALTALVDHQAANRTEVLAARRAGNRHANEVAPAAEADRANEAARVEAACALVEQRIGAAREATARADQKASLLALVPATLAAVAVSALPGLDGPAVALAWTTLAATATAVAALGTVAWPRKPNVPQLSETELRERAQQLADDPELRLDTLAAEAGHLERLVAAKWSAHRVALVAAGVAVVLAIASAITGSL